jgi:hypothetical protein
MVAILAVRLICPDPDYYFTWCGLRDRRGGGRRSCRDARSWRLLNLKKRLKIPLPWAKRDKWKGPRERSEDGEEAINAGFALLFSLLLTERRAVVSSRGASVRLLRTRRLPRQDRKAFSWAYGFSFLARS